jgi:hypothetical protein
MRRTLALCLGGVLLLGGCPSQQIPSVVNVLTVGTYTGTVDCVSKATGQADVPSQLAMTVVVTEQKQLYIWDVPYFVGMVLDLSDSTQGITGSVTINDISEAGSTLTATGSGSLTKGTATYAMTHSVALVQSSDTQLQVTYITAGEDAADSKSIELNCGGTLTR